MMKERIQALEEKLNNSEENCKFYEDHYQLYKAKYEQAVRAYDQLLFAFKQFQRREFGAKSERFKDQIIQQVDMFSKVPAELPEENKEEEDESADSSPEKNPNPSAKKKRRTKSQHFLKGLPRREVIIPAEDKQENSIVIRYEIKEYLHYIPPVYEVVIEKREVVKTLNPETGLVTLYTVPVPKRLLQAGVTENFLA